MIYKNIELYNIVEMNEDKKTEGFVLSRIPGHVRDKLNDAAQKAAFNGCGCELRFNIDEDFVKVKLKRNPGEGVVADYGIVEIYYGCFQDSWENSPAVITNETTEIMIRKPEKIEQLKQLARESGHLFDPEIVRVLLPYDWGNCFIDIEGKCSPPRIDQIPPTRILTYGSSITHGGSSAIPSRSYASQTAILLEMDLINLGFAGSAKLEAEMADYIAERDDWDVALLEMGINVIGKWSAKEFEEKVDYFIERIAERNKDKWVFCIDIFTTEMDYQEDKKVDEFRLVVKNKVERLQLPKLKYISGKNLLTSCWGLTTDLVHPSVKGMEEISVKLANVISEYI